MSRDAHRWYVQELRREVAEKQQAGGFDEEALRGALWYLGQAEALLDEPDFEHAWERLFLTHVEGATQHLGWARQPIRDAEARRDHNRRAAKPGELRSKAKRQAIEHYLATDPQPESREAWERMLDVAGIPYPETGTGKWYTEARKLRDANRT